MTKIVSGIVAYEDGVKATEGDTFSPTRKVRVELNFAADSNDESLTDVDILSVINKAQSFVQEKLGISGPTHAAKRTTKKTAAAEPPAGPSVAEAQERNVKAVAESSKATAKVLNDKEKLAAAQGLIPGAKPAKPVDPAAIEEEETVEDALAGLEDETPPTPVTDADLNAAVKAKNATLKDPVKIRALAAEYNGGPGHTLADIPQEKRAEFVAKLEALK